METRDLVGVTQNRQYFCKVERCPEYKIEKEDYKVATSHAHDHIDTYKKNYLYHTDTHKKKFKCEICPSYFINEKTLIHHMKSHVDIPTPTTHTHIDEDAAKKNRELILAKDFKDIFDVEYSKDNYIKEVDKILKKHNYSEVELLMFKKTFDEGVEYVKDNAIKKIIVPTDVFDVKKHIELKYLKKLMLDRSIDLNKDLMKQLPTSLRALRNIILYLIDTAISPKSYRGLNAYVADNTYNYMQILYYIENYRKKLVESFAYIGEPSVDVKDAINFLVGMQKEKEKETANILVGMQREKERDTANILVGMKRKRSEDDYGGRVKSRRNKSNKSKKSKSRRNKSNKSNKSKKSKSRRNKSKKSKGRRNKSNKSKSRRNKGNKGNKGKK
jgi:hypothetical protein